jgi:hypothetical protein
MKNTLQTSVEVEKYTRFRVYLFFPVDGVALDAEGVMSSGTDALNKEKQKMGEFVADFEEGLKQQV